MEQALVFASIIVGVAVSDQVMSINRLLVARHRVKWDWAPLILALLVLLTNMQLWWSVASWPRTTITIGAFLPMFVLLIFLALLSAASLPGDIDGDGEFDLRNYYDRHARYLWTLFSIALFWSLGMGTAEHFGRGSGMWELSHRAIEIIPLAMMVSLIFVRARWWLVICLAVLALGPLNWLTLSLN
jgi:hypothetical protein